MLSYITFNDDKGDFKARAAACSYSETFVWAPFQDRLVFDASFSQGDISPAWRRQDIRARLIK